MRDPLRRQRRRRHETANVLGELPNPIQEHAQHRPQQSWTAENKAPAEKT
ncbi:MAG: hypothetical protein LDL11_02280 [Desulfarculus sp.]|nr:hypothetical protein [Desulfarculus sp.]